MATIGLQPFTDSTHHPAYRYLILRVINEYATPADQYGVEIELVIDSVTYTFQSRKVIGTIFGDNIYELDLQALLQSVLSFNLQAYTYGRGETDVDVLAMLEISGEVFDLYLDANGVVTRDDINTDTLSEILVTNSAIQHEGWIGGGLFHFTMRDYLSTVMGANFSWLTFKPDHSEVCLGDSEFLSFLWDDEDINGVEVITYNSAGVVISSAMYNLPSAITGTSGLITNGFRNIGVGPENINNTTWDHIYTSAPVIDSSVDYYVIQLGSVIDILGTPVLVPLKERTYHMACPCCDERERFYFLNSLGAIDAVFFNGINEGLLAVKSTMYQKNLDVPHRVDDAGNLRLNVDSAPAIKVGRIFTFEEKDFMYEVVRTIRMWRWIGGEYVAMKVKDDTVKINAYDDKDFFVEFEIEFANGYLNQQN